MEENSSPAGKNKLSKLAFWEVGLFEVFFAAIVLVLLFGILNYFNILSVSDAFPNQLGWLPKQAQKKNITDITAKYTKLAPSTDEMKALLTQYVRGTIRPELLSGGIKLEKGLSFSGEVYATQSGFRSKYYVSATYNGSKPDLALYIPLQNYIENFNATSSSIFARGFLISFPENWKCTTGKLSKACESQWIENGTLNCVAVKNIAKPGQSYIIKYQIPQESVNFSQKQCINVF